MNNQFFEDFVMVTLSSSWTFLEDEQDQWLEMAGFATCGNHWLHISLYLSFPFGKTVAIYCYVLPEKV